MPTSEQQGEDEAYQEPLRPSSYAPYRNPRDYILSWTDRIWIDRAIGLLHDHYSADIKVHTAYGETYDYAAVIANSVQKFAAFPNAGGGLGEDVVWEQRGPEGFISSHRTLRSGTHTGPWTYGPATNRDFISRTIAHCLVQENRIVEEWLVRDEYAVLQGIGLDPQAVAAELAARSPVLGTAVAIDGQAGPFAGRIADAATLGISGPRPRRHLALAATVQAMFEDVWNRRRFDLTGRYVHERIVCNTVRMRRVQNLVPYQIEIINLLASFPDAQIELRDIAVHESEELGTRVAVVWVLRGTYGGVPSYGPPTHGPVFVLGATHLEMLDGKVLREWRLFDELAILTQISRARSLATAT